MARLKKRGVLQGLVLFIVCVASALIGFALRNNYANTPKSDQLPVIQRSDEKVIEIKEFPGKPFEISDLSVKKVKIIPGGKLKVRSVAESEEWLDGLEFNIKNKWDNKIITYIDLDLTFPETGVGRPRMVYDLDLGIHPMAFGDALKYGQPLALNPGDTFTFTLSAKRLEMIKKFLELGGFRLADLNNATIRIDTIFFDDGMKWDQGNWYKLVPGEKLTPGRPAKYERVNK